VQNTLNFCNSCGTKLAKTADQPVRGRSPVGLLIAGISVIDTVGLFILALLTLIFLDRHVDEKIMAAIITFYLFFLAVVNFRFLRMISKLVNVYIENKVPQSEPQPAGLFSHTTAQLQEPRQPVSSVTDHTTRTLDEVLLKER
jgi:hypothetical protein